MAEVGLYDLIKYIERGTSLHIGVLFFGNYGNELCRLPHGHKIHSSPICEKFKNGHSDYRRCFRCRNAALRRAVETKKPFGGYCVNGIFEYTHPIVLNDEVIAMVFIGNVLRGGEENTRLMRRVKDERGLLSTMESGFDEKELAEIAEIIEGHILMLLEKGGECHDFENTLIENIKSYIRTNREFNLSAEHIAEVFHYNKSYLGRRFKQETGISIAEYLQKARLDMAFSYLTDTSLTVLEISGRCGFSEVAYFNRVFKAHTGMTPTEYRLKIKNDSVM